MTPELDLNKKLNTIRSELALKQNETSYKENLGNYFVPSFLLSSIFQT